MNTPIIKSKENDAQVISDSLINNPSGQKVDEHATKSMMFEVVHFSGSLFHLLINFAKVGDLNSHLLDLNSADLASNINPARMPYPISPRMMDTKIKLIRVGLSITKMNDNSAKLEIEN